MKFEQIHNQNERLLLQCISGSKAYGLDTPLSDTDIKGVFYLPKEEMLGMYYTPQVNNESNDIAYYELTRFFELLVKNNPNILELLATPAESVLYKHPLMDLVKPEMFISKLCYPAFAGYAASQIKKARGLNKKIHNPVDKERKHVLDFCYAIRGSQALPLAQWLKENKYVQEECGLVRIDHFKDTYALFHQKQTAETKFAGIYSGEDADDVRLSHIPKGLEPVALINFQKDTYSTYCRDYKEYWNWVEKRNETRYTSNMQHGKNYDTKNMMHTFRLLHMANEIALEGKINVRRNDREFLFKIKNGEFEYDELMEMSDKLLETIRLNFEKSNLPEAPDEQKANKLLVDIRTQLLK